MLKYESTKVNVAIIIEVVTLLQTLIYKKIWISI